VRVLVFGGRGFGNPKVRGKNIEDARREYRFIFDLLDRVDEERQIETIISGMADGADSVAADWAKKRKVDLDPYPAAWDDIDRPGAVVKRNRSGKEYDVTAGFFRNQRMIDEGKPDFGIGFPGGSGTADMASRLNRAGIRHWLVTPPPDS
jgi:hypothetical protein